MLFYYALHWEQLGNRNKTKQNLFEDTRYQKKIHRAKIWKKGEVKRGEPGLMGYSSSQGNCQLWKEKE